MFTLKAFPNATEDFLTAYRFCRIISQKWPVTLSPISSDLPYPIIQNKFLPKIQGIKMNDPVSLWIGSSVNVGVSLNKDYAIITEKRLGYSATLNQMIDFVLPENVIYPCYPQDVESEGYILIYILPHSIDINTFLQIIRCYNNSTIRRDLRILAPYFDKNMVRSLLSDAKVTKNVYLSCPTDVSPDIIDKCFLQAYGYIDIKNFESLSYASILALSAGKLCVSGISYPRCYNLNPSRKYVLEDGRRYNGMDRFEYRDQDIIDVFDRWDIIETSKIDNTNILLEMFGKMIKGEVLR